MSATAAPHRYDSNTVFETVRPHLTRVYDLGARLFVECTPEFLGRDPRVLQRLGEATGLRILSNTGLYGARTGKYLPPYVAAETAEQLAARWITEARDGIEGTGIRPGFVKCGVNTNAELSVLDRKLVEAAALTHRETGLTIAVHTGAGPGLAQIGILKAHGVASAAWIWVHAQSARDTDILAAAEQGAWVSFDDLRPETMKRHLELCRLLRDQKRLDQVLLSHDAGWYDPAKPEGGVFRGYQVLFTQFLPALKEAGFTEAERHQLVTENPARAFSIGRRLLAANCAVQEASERQRTEQSLPAKAKRSAAARAQEQLGWRLGIEAYTFHKFTFFETIDKTAALGLPYVGGLSFMQKVSKDIPKNFDQHLSDDELRQIRLKMESAGVRLLTYYAQTIPDDETGCRKLFEFGRKMGFETFMCEPKPEQLDLLDKLANEYGINVAIHNHGPNISPVYWKPENVLKACEGRSRRIGAAPDLGYWLRNGVDPVEAVRLLKERVITVQMHDLHEAGGQGHDVPWGMGIGQAEAFFRELHRQGIKPTMIGLEYSHNWLDSMPEIARCIEFFNATTLKLVSESTTQGTP